MRRRDTYKQPEWLPDQAAHTMRRVEGDLVDMSGRTLREPNFPRLQRQTPIQRTFLKRLQRLVLLGRYSEQHLAFTDDELTLLRRATFSVFEDCLALGVAREARAILKAGSSAVE